MKRFLSLLQALRLGFLLALAILGMLWFGGQRLVSAQSLAVLSFAYMIAAIVGGFVFNKVHGTYPAGFSLRLVLGLVFVLIWASAESIVGNR